MFSVNGNDNWHKSSLTALGVYYRSWEDELFTNNRLTHHYFPAQLLLKYGELQSHRIRERGSPTIRTCLLSKVAKAREEINQSFLCERRERPRYLWIYRPPCYSPDLSLSGLSDISLERPNFGAIYASFRTNLRNVIVPGDGSRFDGGGRINRFASRSWNEKVRIHERREY